MKAKILFIHPEKTGGSALRTALESFGDTSYWVSHWHELPAIVQDTKLDKVDVIGGHVPLAYFHHFEQPRIKIFSIRDPRTRELSYYHHLKSNPLVSWDIRKNFQHLSFESFMHRNIRKERMCELLCGAKCAKAAIDVLGAYDFLVLRQEYLQRDFNALCSLMGTQPFELQKENVSSYAKFERTHETDELVETYCPHDCILYEHVMENWQK